MTAPVADACAASAPAVVGAGLVAAPAWRPRLIVRRRPLAQRRRRRPAAAGARRPALGRAGRRAPRAAPRPPRRPRRRAPARPRRAGSSAPPSSRSRPRRGDVAGRRRRRRARRPQRLGGFVDRSQIATGDAEAAATFTLRSRPPGSTTRSPRCRGSRTSARCSRARPTSPAVHLGRATGSPTPAPSAGRCCRALAARHDHQAIAALKARLRDNRSQIARAQGRARRAAPPRRPRARST